MQKAILILLVLLNISCGSYKNNKNCCLHLEDYEVESFIAKQNYIVTIPSSWHPVADHNYVSYSPKNLGDAFHKNIVNIFDITPKGETKDSLRIVVQDRLNKHYETIKVESYNISKIQTRFGDTYVYKYKYKWYYVYYEAIKWFFEYENKYYSFNYHSDVKFFKKYLDDANYMFEMLEFKDKVKDIQKE